MDIDLVATSFTWEIVSLYRLRYHSASEMLGVCIVPDGNNKKLVQVLQKSTIERGTKIRIGNGSQKKHGKHCTRIFQQN